MHKIHDIDKSTFCMLCNQDIFDMYIPTANDINEVIINFPKFYNDNSNALNYSFWIRYYPKQLKCLAKYFENITNKQFNKDVLPEVYYVALNKLNESPKCPECNDYIT